MRRIPLLLTVLSLFALAGCHSSDLPEPQTMLGLSQEQVVDQLGKPGFVKKEVFRPGMMNGPRGLTEAEAYTVMNYPKMEGQTWWLYLGTPAQYERITGKKWVVDKDHAEERKGAEGIYVFDIETFGQKNSGESETDKWLKNPWNYQPPGTTPP